MPSMWLVLFLRHCTGAALHRRHGFGALWEDWSTNTAAASSIPGLSGCVNREGFVPLSTSVVWVGTDSATGGRLSKCFTAAVTTIYGRPEKKQPTAVVRPKEPQLNFIFQLLKHVRIVSVVRNKVRYFVSGGWQMAQRSVDCSV